MKTYEQLTPEQQTKAVNICTTELLTSICEGALKFNDEMNQDNLQARIDAAWAQAEKLHTPWFIGEIIMETCAEDIRGMAQCTAEDALYPEPNEHVIRGIG